MRQRAWRLGIPVAAGCLLAALALALLSLVSSGPSAHRPVPTALRTAVAQAGNVLRSADAGHPGADVRVPAPLDRLSPPAVPYALLPTALVLAAAGGVLAARARRPGRSARPHRGVPAGRGPPVWLFAA